MGLLNVYSFNKTIKPHIAYRFKVTFFYNKGAEEIESLTYYVKSVELPIWNMNTENRQRFGNTQYVIPIFDFGQSTLKIVFMETDKMSVTYFLNGFLFNNIENADMEANLWNNCAPKIIKIKIDELDQSMRNTVVSNIYACHLKRLSSPNFSNLNFGNPIEVEAEFVVRYKLNSIAEEIGEVHSSLPDPETFKEDILNSRTQEENNKAATIHQNKANALSTQRLLTQSEMNAIQMNLTERLSRAQSLGLNSSNEEYAAIEKQLDLFKKRSELIKNNGSVDEILEIDRQLASVNTLNVTGASSNDDTGLRVSNFEAFKNTQRQKGLCARNTLNAVDAYYGTGYISPKGSGKDIATNESLAMELSSNKNVEKVEMLGKQNITSVNDINKLQSSLLKNNQTMVVSIKFKDKQAAINAGIPESGATHGHAMFVTNKDIVSNKNQKTISTYNEKALSELIKKGLVEVDVMRITNKTT